MRSLAQATRSAWVWGGVAARPPRRFALGLAVTAAFVLAGPSMALASSGLSAPVPVDPSFFAYSVSCPSASFCAAVGGNGAR